MDGTGHYLAGMSRTLKCSLYNTVFTHPARNRLLSFARITNPHKYQQEIPPYHPSAFYFFKRR